MRIQELHHTASEADPIYFASVWDANTLNIPSVEKLKNTNV